MRGASRFRWLRFVLLGLVASVLLACGRKGAPSGPPLARVLFVGNSYTFVNDLPGRLKALAASGESPVALEVDSVAVGSATLLDHAHKTGAVERIARGGWTYVVLQGQSVEPAFAPADFERGARELAATARAAGAIPVFYETWARAAGNEVYAQRWSGGAPAALHDKLHSEYAKLASETGGRIVPAGEAWSRALGEDARAPLYASDGSHPSISGTYLTACVFYAVLVGRSPEGLAALPGSMGPEEGAKWQRIAWDTSGGSRPL